MNYIEQTVNLEVGDFKIPEETSIIKVIGVGGGGSNAVNYMYSQGIVDVSFAVCNTDDQALQRSPVPYKLQLGVNTTEGLGAGGQPERARTAALESLPEIEAMLGGATKMAFITAGMGGGTGTGAAPVIAEAARRMGILTVGIVTIPFLFEGKRKILQALAGVSELNKYVDALLVIHNEKLCEIYPDLVLSNAFSKADDVLTNAARGIAEIITLHGYINVDFADVQTIMKNGRVAVMNTGYSNVGENCISEAIMDALDSPLLNNADMGKANKILLNIYSSHDNEVTMEQINQINLFIEQMGDEVEVIWGAAFDETLGDCVKVTLIATGFDIKQLTGEASVPDLDSSVRKVKLGEDPEAVAPLAAAAKEELLEQYYGALASKPKSKSSAIAVGTLDALDNEEELERVSRTSALSRQSGGNPLAARNRPTDLSALLLNEEGNISPQNPRLFNNPD